MLCINTTRFSSMFFSWIRDSSIIDNMLWIFLVKFTLLHSTKISPLMRISLKVSLKAFAIMNFLRAFSQIVNQLKWLYFTSTFKFIVVKFKVEFWKKENWDFLLVFKQFMIKKVSSFQFQFDVEKTFENCRPTQNSDYKFIQPKINCNQG